MASAQNRAQIHVAQQEQSGESAEQLSRFASAATKRNQVVPFKHRFEQARTQKMRNMPSAANDPAWQETEAGDQQNEQVQRQRSLANAQRAAQMQKNAQNTNDALKPLLAEGARRASIVQSATKLAFSHRKKVREGDFSVFLMPFALALSKDGILDLIPILGAIPGLFVFIYLTIFLWGKGTLKWKILRMVLMIIDLVIPIVNLIPFTTFCVWIAYRHAKRDAEKAKKTVREIHRVTNEEISKPVLA